jgi:hypothetical protein
VKELRVNLTETYCHHSRHTQSHTGRRRRFPRSLVGFIEFRRFEFRGDRDDPNPAAAVNSLTGREGWNVAPHLTPVQLQVEIHVRKPSDAGAIPEHLAPIMERLALNRSNWVEIVRGFGRLFKPAAGRSTSLIDAAARRSRRWFQGQAAGRAAFV